MINDYKKIIRDTTYLLYFTVKYNYYLFDIQ